MLTTTIEIEVPEATCSRCCETAPLEPSTARRIGQHKWEAVNFIRPHGWTADPSKPTELRQGLCVPCAADLQRTFRDFLSSEPTQYFADPAKVAAVRKRKEGQKETKIQQYQSKPDRVSISSTPQPVEPSAVSMQRMAPSVAPNISHSQPAINQPSVSVQQSQPVPQSLNGGSLKTSARPSMPIHTGVVSSQASTLTLTPGAVKVG